MEREKFLNNMVKIALKKEGIYVFIVEEMATLKYFIKDMNPSIFLVDIDFFYDENDSRFFIDLLENLKEQGVKLYFTYRKESLDRLHIYKKWGDDFLEKPLFPLKFIRTLKRSL